MASHCERQHLTVLGRTAVDGCGFYVGGFYGETIAIDV